MAESKIQNKFNHLKIHSQYSICEGAIKIDELKDYSKENQLRSLGLCDTNNLCGALEFAEKISKVGTQPIIGTQINFKFNEQIGIIPLIAKNDSFESSRFSKFGSLESERVGNPTVLRERFDLAVTRHGFRVCRSLFPLERFGLRISTPFYRAKTVISNGYIKSLSPHNYYYYSIG